MEIYLRFINITIKYITYNIGIFAEIIKWVQIKTFIKVMIRQEYLAMTNKFPELIMEHPEENTLDVIGTQLP